MLLFCRARPSKNSAKIVIILIWAVSLALASPIAVALQVVLVKEVVDRKFKVYLLNNLLCRLPCKST